MSLFIDGFGLNKDQVEILYNIDYHKTLYDIDISSNLQIHELKKEWLAEWKKYMEIGFPDFTKLENVTLKWYTKTELLQKIADSSPSETWYRLVLLEAMTFEPYFPIAYEDDENSDNQRKYKKLWNPVNGYKEKDGDHFLDAVFAGEFCSYGYINRLRKCYEKCVKELNAASKTGGKIIPITVLIAGAATAAVAGALAPAIAITLVGANFAGLSGAALTSTCLAYIGGGAIASGGAGMAGGTMIIVGGGAALGAFAGGGIGEGVSEAINTIDIAEKENIIIQSAKLMVSVREIFLNDEHDLEYANQVYEEYVENIKKIEQDLVELRLDADVSQAKEKKDLNERIKQTEKTVDAMKAARKSMLKFISSFQEGLDSSDESTNNMG